MRLADGRSANGISRRQIAFDEAPLREKAPRLWRCQLLYYPPEPEEM